MIIGISGKIGSGKDTVGKIIQWLTSNHLTEIWLNDFECFLEESHKYDDSEANFYIKKFADKLKDIVCLLINCTREQLEDEVFKNTELGKEWCCYIFNNGKKEELTLDYHIAKMLSADNRIISRILTPRLLLQLLGTDCGRDIIHPNIWVNSLFNEYKLINKGFVFPKENYPEIDSKATYLEYPNWIITDVRFPNELEAVKKRNGITIRLERFNQISENVRVHGIGVPHPSETALDDAEFDYIIYNNGTIKELIEMVKNILIEKQIIK